MRVFSIALVTFTSVGVLSLVLGQTDDSNIYFGQASVPLDTKNKAPLNDGPDPFGSSLFIDGETVTPMDIRSAAAQTLEEMERIRRLRKGIDRSIRADITSGQPVTVLIAPEHFVQLTFLRDGEIVFPKRAFTGQPELLIIDKQENSPYVYVQASAMVEGQTTNLFVETEEDGRIQTYVLNLLVTEPKNIREQVSVNLVEDKTPPIRGTVRETPIGATHAVQNPLQDTSTSMRVPLSSEKWGEKEIKTYLSTMIEMTEHYSEAKRIERETGRVIYRDSDIQGFPSGKFNYIDPVEKTIWNVQQVWYFPRYDAILLDVRKRNPNKGVSMWDFSQVKWKANNSPLNFDTSAAAPQSMQTLPNRTNRIWFLLQGYRLDPRAEFTPVFPREGRRIGNPNTHPVGSRSNGLHNP